MLGRLGKGIPVGQCKTGGAGNQSAYPANVKTRTMIEQAILAEYEKIVGKQDPGAKSSLTLRRHQPPGVDAEPEESPETARFSPNIRAIDYSPVRRYKSRQGKGCLNFLYIV
jgi:hypothetical protein